MAQRRKLLLGLTVAAAFVAAMVMTRGDAEPSYKGRALSDWILIIAWNESGPGAEAREAIGKIGTNAIPFLLKWIRYQPANWQVSVNTVMEKSGVGFLRNRWFPYNDRKAVLRQKAVIGFEVLGKTASPALPELIALAELKNAPSVQRAAIGALPNLGKESLPTLLGILERTNRAGRFYAAMAVRRLNDIDSNAVGALPALVRYTADKDGTVAYLAVGALGKLPFDPKTTIATLTNSLANQFAPVRSAAATSLLAFPIEDRSATPLLVTALSDQNLAVRKAATNALRVIAPEVLTNTPAQ